MRPRQVGHHLALHGAGVAGAIVLAVDVDGEDGELPLLQMVGRPLGVAQIGKAEERRHRLAQRLLHGAEAELDFGARLAPVIRACRLACDQVWVPTVCPWRAYSCTISGSATAMRPTTKKVALVQCAARASSIGLV